MKRLMALLLVMGTVLLCGCGSTPKETVSNSQPDPSTEATVTDPTDITEPSGTLPPVTEPEATEPPVSLYHNPFTGEPLESLSLNRPFCIVFNNTKASLPQHGMGSADIVYETLIEGETRFMGVFYDLQSKGEMAFGAIRSARRDYVRLAMGHDAIFAHYGSSEKIPYGAKEYFDATGWNHLDGINTSKYYYTARKGQGYASEHTHFTKANLLVAYAESKHFQMERENSVDMHWQFDEDATVAGETANSVTAWFNLSNPYSTKWNESTTLTYNKGTGLYEASHHYATDSKSTSLSDGNTGKPIAFRNVLILKTRIEKLETTHMKIDVTGSGTGYFALGGKIVPIRWSRSDERAPYVFTLEDGTPITLGVGKTYIAIIPNAGDVIVK